MKADGLHGFSATCCFLILALSGCAPETPELGTADYASLQLRKGCAAGAKPGSSDATDALAAAEKVRYSVRTPRNYDATLAHPLLVVFAPAGYARHASEHYYGLTHAATAAGFVVAYPDHLGLSMRAFQALGKLPSTVSAQWCIDESRVYFAGHSDGGTTSAAIAFLHTSLLTPHALFISAAGIRGQDLAQYACPGPLSVMIVHSSRDSRFALPDYGKAAAQWWARCNHCSEQTVQSPFSGCVEYAGCAEHTSTAYCEVSTAHADWPPVNAHLLRFFAESARLP